METTKPTNPKDAVGVLKTPMSVVPPVVIAELGLGMYEGARKYGAYNFRTIGVKASIYYDATMRHLMSWWEGEDLDPDSGAGLHHITKAIASLTVIRDAMIRGKFTDDRPPKTHDGWMKDLDAKVVEINKRYPNPVKPYTQIELTDEPSRP